MTVSLIVHGHYYQPPRENPWLEEVEVEPSAAPYHDWNARIERECYRAVIAARVLGPTGRIARMINTLGWTSFNYGPTLFNWLQAAAPDTYDAVIQADRDSVLRFGHGSALAHPYHHVILPLSTRRDKVTEVRWGIEDFRRRYGREPEGMWLPETAVDEETLDVLAEAGIRFTILAPHQATPLPPDGLPGLYRTRSGRSIALCFYDGNMSHDVAFGELIRDAGKWSARIRALAAQRPNGVIAVATDGETFGHHHKFGEMALARVIHEFGGSGQGAIRVDNFASLLARTPAVHEVELVPNTSWSCAHGVERWRSNCGCRVDPNTQQKWRAPLREAMDWLAAEAHRIYERDGGAALGDVWAARDAYDPHLGSPPGGRDVRTRELLELERHALLLYTSCAWFFDDIGGIEPVQVLKYAARLVQLAGSEGPRLEAGLLERLARAPSNDRAAGTGRDIYLARVKPTLPEEVRLAAGLAALDMAGVPVEEGRAAAYDSTVETRGAAEFTVQLTHRRTGATSRVEISGSKVPESALWDRHLRLLREDRRRDLAAMALSPEQQLQVSTGALTLAEAASLALVEAVAQLGREIKTLPRVEAALDLLEQLNQPIPFDAQARFAPVAERAVTEPALERVAARLGFETL
jgi:hypothetical protein